MRLQNKVRQVLRQGLNTNTRLRYWTNMGLVQAYIVPFLFREKSETRKQAK